MSANALRTGIVVAKSVAAVAVVGYVGLLAALYFGQERLLFPATPLPADYQFKFDQHFEEIRVPVAGGSLDALLFRQPAPRGLVFFLHGNRGDLNTWTTGLEFYRRINYDLFIVDYRGYGKSSGRIESEAQLRADVRAAWDTVAPRYRDKPIVIYGRSLGTGLAAELARDVHPSLLVLVSPFTNLAAAAQRRYPFAPAFLLKYPMRTDAIIGDITSPMLLVAGSEDRLTPVGDSLRLQSLAHAPVDLLVVAGAGHVNIHRYPAYLDGLADRLTRVAGG
jgi:uncharacterized protein